MWSEIYVPTNTYFCYINFEWLEKMECIKKRECIKKTIVLQNKYTILRK